MCRLGDGAARRVSDGRARVLGATASFRFWVGIAPTRNGTRLGASTAREVVG